MENIKIDHTQLYANQSMNERTNERTKIFIQGVHSPLVFFNEALQKLLYQVT